MADNTPKSIRDAIVSAQEEAEALRLAGDYLVMISGAANGLYGLSHKGRLFFRELDSRGNMNMPGVGQKYIWREVEGPFS